MKKYLVSVHKKVHQYWEVEAESEEDAKIYYNEGKMKSEKVSTDHVKSFEDFYED